MYIQTCVEVVQGKAFILENVKKSYTYIIILNIVNLNAIFKNIKAYLNPNIFYYTI